MWLDWANPFDLMPRTRETVAQQIEERRVQREAAIRQEQQRQREAEQRWIAGLRVSSNPTGSSKSSHGANVGRKASKTSVADVDVEMASEVGSTGTARTGRGAKAKSEMPDSENPPAEAVEVRRNNCRSNSGY